MNHITLPKDCCSPSAPAESSSEQKSTKQPRVITLRLPANLHVVGYVMVAVIAIFSLVQTAQLYELRRAYLGGQVPAAAAATNANNIDTLPNMVGGC